MRVTPDMNAELTIQVVCLAEHLNALGWSLGTAESCTGGGIGYYLTELAGASSWFAGGVLAYNNGVKQDALDVNADTLLRHGAVSQEVVTQMARGVFKSMNINCSVAVSGVAGPDGGTTDKPVGCVWFAWAWRDTVGNTQVRTHRAQFTGNRSEVRMQAVMCAIEGLIYLCEQVRKNLSVPADLIAVRDTKWL